MNDGRAADDPRLAHSDDRARADALDVSRSFIVQAPAGSGKTELLIQRFLALLAIVDRPEAIVAMTFTRKAAGEMRARILAALADAVHDGTPASAHAARTRALARAALGRDRALGWQLVKHPARLRIVTIDAIATGLAHDAPLATRTGGMPALTERPEALYRAAASAALADADAADPAWRTLLDHLDNHGERAVALLAQMLSQRDQWLRHLVGVDPADLRETLEATLTREIEAELASVRAFFPDRMRERITHLARYATRNLGVDDPAVKLREALDACIAAGGLPGASCAELATWRTLADWLLVKEPAWRKQITMHQGFLAKGNGGMAREREARKEEMLALLADLERIPGLAHVLHGLRSLPPPRYSDAEWSVVAALLALLPRCAAELKLQFAAARTIDFGEAMELALTALGTPEAPSDVLLALDRRIAHLLIDEFQDTSLVQRDLVARLTAGWEEGDGRTLFVVGDPMQSIYRFREAEVRLFLDAQREQRLEHVRLHPLTLARNFRSQHGLVTWINTRFAAILPPVDDAARGAVAFKPSLATREAWAEAAVTLDLAETECEEARLVVSRVQQALAHTPDDVAILVRARTHLLAILPALRAAGVAFQAVELDRLTERPAVRDLLALTHALVQPADRLAWLAILRAPWCGLRLADLLAIVQGGREVASTVLEGTAVEGLSAAARERLARVALVLRTAIAERGRLPLALAVRGVWLALGGPATLTDTIDLEAAERYFALLAAHAIAGDVPDWSSFMAAVDALHAEAEIEGTHRVQVMTLHRAKGLEFGTVILAGLARRPPHATRPLLQWRVRPRGLMLAPMRARTEAQEDGVYAYLSRLAEEEGAAEAGRLFYVGATRAKHRLRLTACLRVREEEGERRWCPPGAGSLLAKLWPQIEGSVAVPSASAEAPKAAATASAPLVRLSADWRPPAVPASVFVLPAAVAVEPLTVFDWVRETARHVGTIAHRMLARIAGQGLETWNAERVAGLRDAVRAELRLAGVDGAEIEAAIASVQTALVRLLADARGRWLFDGNHAEAVSELALAGVDGGAVVHVVLDRTFVCDGERWIVDFKTSAHEGGELEAFLDREQARYAETLERYARLMRNLDARPIRLGLYYPLVGGWREWRFRS